MLTLSVGVILLRVVISFDKMQKKMHVILMFTNIESVMS